MIYTVCTYCSPNLWEPCMWRENISKWKKSRGWHRLMAPFLVLLFQHGFISRGSALYTAFQLCKTYLLMKSRDPEVQKNREHMYHNGTNSMILVQRCSTTSKTTVTYFTESLSTMLFISFSCTHSWVCPKIFPYPLMSRHTSSEERR